MKRILFEKTYDKSCDIVIPEKEKENIKSTMPTAEEFLRSINEDTEYVLVEDRMKGLKTFIEVVKEVSDYLEADVVIEERDFGASANLRITDCSIERYTKKAFVFMLAKADAISWFTKKDHILLSLDYYTHELYFKGKCMHHIT